MAVVVKVIRGRAYRYEQTSQRINGKVVTKSVYLGAVNPKRPRRGGFAIGTAPINAILFAAYFAGKALQGKMKTVQYKDKPTDPLAREKQKAQIAVEKLDRYYGIDKSSAEAFQASRARLPKEMLMEHFKAEKAAWRTVDAERTKAATPMSPAMKGFSDRLASKGTDPSEAPAGDEGEGES